MGPPQRRLRKVNTTATVSARPRIPSNLGWRKPCRQTRRSVIPTETHGRVRTGSSRPRATRGFETARTQLRCRRCGLACFNRVQHGTPVAARAPISVPDRLETSSLSVGVPSHSLSLSLSVCLSHFLPGYDLGCQPAGSAQHSVIALQLCRRHAVSSVWNPETRSRCTPDPAGAHAQHHVLEAAWPHGRVNTPAVARRRQTGMHPGRTHAGAFARTGRARCAEEPPSLDGSFEPAAVAAPSLPAYSEGRESVCRAGV